MCMAVQPDARRQCACASPCPPCSLPPLTLSGGSEGSGVSSDRFPARRSSNGFATLDVGTPFCLPQRSTDIKTGTPHSITAGVVSLFRIADNTRVYHFLCHQSFVIVHS